jgi:hypothetical protein
LINNSKTVNPAVGRGEKSFAPTLQRFNEGFSPTVALPFIDNFRQIFRGISVSSVFKIPANIFLNAENTEPRSPFEQATLTWNDLQNPENCIRMELAEDSPQDDWLDTKFAQSFDDFQRVFEVWKDKPSRSQLKTEKLKIKINRYVGDC